MPARFSNACCGHCLFSLFRDQFFSGLCLPWQKDCLPERIGSIQNLEPKKGTTISSFFSRRILCWSASSSLASHAPSAMCPMHWEFGWHSACRVSEKECRNDPVSAESGSKCLIDHRLYVIEKKSNNIWVCVWKKHSSSAFNLTVRPFVGWMLRQQ